MATLASSDKAAVQLSNPIKSSPLLGDSARPEDRDMLL